MEWAIIFITLDPKFQIPEFTNGFEVIVSNAVGRSKARNLAALKARNPFLLFIDGDSWISRESINQYIIEPMKRNRNSIVCFDAPILSTRVLAISKENYFKIGGLDETFEVAEDVEFGLRAMKMGYKISYVPKELVIHTEHDRNLFLGRIFNFINAIRYLLRYKIVILWSQKLRDVYITKFTPLNIIKMFTQAPRKGFYIPIRVVISIFSFYYYLHLNKRKGLEQYIIQ
jgi:GT2 family glycosyltransferase